MKAFSVIVLCCTWWAVATLAQAQTLTWDANSEPDIDHYKIYQCDDPMFVELECTTSVDEVIHPVTTYDVSAVAPETWFRITGVDTSENESGFSGIVDSTIPAIPSGMQIKVQFTVTVE